MKFKKTKIVATIGPSSSNPSTLKQMVQSGLNVARLNFSHGSHPEKLGLIKIIREISQELNKPITIYADLSGPKLRLGEIEGIKEIRKGDEINLSTEPQDDFQLPMQFDLAPFVQPKQRIFLNDGLVALEVQKVSGKVIFTQALNSGWVSSHKGVNVPETRLKGATFTTKDKEDCEFALSQNVDYIGLSFIQSPEDLDPALEMIKKHHSQAKIVVKIEKPEAITNLEEIIKKTDAVMVARGDLGIEIPAYDVPVIQQKIVRLARQYQKPVIIATQMLESMMENPRPTRAEISDVANAVLDQADAVMLSGETASGKYPIEAVKIMKETILSVEDHPDYKNYIKIDWDHLLKENYSFSAIASAAASLAYRIEAKAIVVATATGRMPRLISSFRPDAQIVAVTHDHQTMNQLSLMWGVRSVLTKPTGSFDNFLSHAISKVKNQGFAKVGDKIVIVVGSTVGISGETDTIKVLTLE